MSSLAKEVASDKAWVRKDQISEINQSHAHCRKMAIVLDRKVKGILNHSQALCKLSKQLLEANVTV